MGKSKEVFLEHQQEQKNIIDSYYNELYKVGYAIGVEKRELKEIINLKPKQNGTRDSKRNA